MQFIEKNGFDVRSAIYRLGRDGDGLEFILFPMIHVGEKRFYEEIGHRLKECDLIFVEGIGSKKARLLVLMYEVIEKIKGFDLVTQHALKLSEFGDRVVHTDMDTETFDVNWSSLPLYTRAMLFLIVPFFIVYLYLWGTRSIIAEHMATDDLPSRDEILSSDEDWDRIDEVIVARRDQVLVERIARLYEEQRGRKKVVGILYGAGHMRAVAGFLLSKLKYRVTKAWWVTVFDL